MADSILASPCPDPADSGASPHGEAPKGSARRGAKPGFADVAERLRPAVSLSGEQPAGTNRELYLGAARIIQIYNSIERALGGSGGAAALAQANAMAKAQAWDAWVASCGGRLKGLRGIPGGILPLSLLERLSREFSRWLDAPCERDGARR